MSRQIPRLLGESPRRNSRAPFALTEAVVGDDQDLTAIRPSEWGERAGALKQIEHASFHQTPDPLSICNISVRLLP
jgi:hypothetical protein